MKIMKKIIHVIAMILMLLVSSISLIHANERETSASLYSNNGKYIYKLKKDPFVRIGKHKIYDSEYAWAVKPW